MQSGSLTRRLQSNANAKKKPKPNSRPKKLVSACLNALLPQQWPAQTPTSDLRVALHASLSQVTSLHGANAKHSVLRPGLLRGLPPPLHRTSPHQKHSCRRRRATSLQPCVQKLTLLVEEPAAKIQLPRATTVPTRQPNGARALSETATVSAAMDRLLMGLRRETCRLCGRMVPLG
jgi:hypothetical protein